MPGDSPDRRTTVLAQLAAPLIGTARPAVLVVGCGSGREAHALSAVLDADVVGVDPYAEFESFDDPRLTLRRDDATALDLADETFDLVYSYHALEHIPSPHTALAEMGRVLRQGGVCVVGTPNRSRVVAYIGDRNSLRTFLAWNAADWSARLRGRFTNEAGAHAGFTKRELTSAMERVFTDVRDCSDAYYDGVYRKRRAMLAVLRRTGLSRVAYPSVYCVGRKA